VGYFWPVALSASLCGPIETVFFTILGVACALVVPAAAGLGVDGVALAANILVLALIGGVLAGFSRTTRHTQVQLERERAIDRAALRLAERVHSSLSLGRVLSLAVEELGRACDAAQAALRLAPSEHGWPPLYEWHRAGEPPLERDVPPPAVQRIFETDEPLIVQDIAELDDEARATLGADPPAAIAALPVRWQDRVIAVLGLQDNRPRDWRESALPLLERAVPQVATALAQAELFEQQQMTLERLEDLNRLREEIVAQVSHELRTPLTSTLGFLRTLERSDLDLDEEERRGLLAIARAEAERLALLVNDLLHLARLDRGAIELSVETVQLKPLVQQAANVLALPEGREVRIEIDDAVVARGDESRLIQVFSNLLTNAIRHGSGRVTVSAEESADEVVVVVSDEGPGIPPERRGELFIPFARWGTSHESTGLGLAIAHGIVQAHGGTLSYQAPVAGRSHGFVVTLPRERATIAA
jgi:signal transduction histidine kinase